jgi:hypothetical protein
VNKSIHSVCVGVSGATVELRFSDVQAEQRFLTSHLLDAWDRYETSSYWEQGWYWPYGQLTEYDAGLDGGLIRLVFDGDPTGLLAAERERWEAFNGLHDWAVTHYEDHGFESLLAQQQDAKGTRGGELEYRYKPLTARLALAIQTEFEEPLPAAPEPSDANVAGVGMWSLVHALYVQCGYDWYEETDSLLRGLQSRVKSIGSFRGTETARAEYDRLLDEWRGFQSELDTWLEAHQTGEESV